MKRKLFFYTLVGILMIVLSNQGYTQGVKMDYANSKEYIIRKLTVETPSTSLNKKVVLQLCGLAEGQKIKVPGEDISGAVDRLWKEQVFTNIKIYHTSIESGFIDLVIYLEEKPRLSRFSIRGVKKSEADDLYEHLKPMLHQNAVVTDYLKKNVEHYIKDFYADKNYFDTRVEFEMKTDTIKLMPEGSLLMRITVDKRNKVKVGRITVEGNEHVRLTKIRRAFKESMYEKSRFDVWKDLGDWITGKKKIKEDTINDVDFFGQVIEYFRNSVRINIFTSSKYNKYAVPGTEDDVIDLFNAKGYRDAKFTKDSIYLKEGDMYGDFKIEEGHQ